MIPVTVADLPATDPDARVVVVGQRAKQAHHRTRRGGRPPVQPCGTPAAHRRHQRHGETPCQRCQDANTLARAERRDRPGAA